MRRVTEVIFPINESNEGFFRLEGLPHVLFRFALQQDEIVIETRNRALVVSSPLYESLQSQYIRLSNRDCMHIERAVKQIFEETLTKPNEPPL